MYRNTLIALFTLIIGLSVAEIYFRMEGRYASYSEQTGKGGYVSPFDATGRKWDYSVPAYYNVNYKQNEFSTAWRANNEGFKDMEFTTHKKGFRLVLIGDSFTEGVGADNDSSLPKQISYLLEDNFSSAYEIWNCGLSGSDPVFEFKVFRDKLLQYRPDMVTVVINASDITDVTTRGGFERFISDSIVRYRRGPWFEPIYAHSYLVRRIVHDLFQYDRLFVAPWDRAGRKQEAYSILESAIDSFTMLCGQKHIKLLFAFHPTEHELEKLSPYEVEPLVHYCQDKKLPYVDIREELYQLGVDSLTAPSLFWKQDWHCNNKGYSYFAKSIYKKVIQELEN